MPNTRDIRNRIKSVKSTQQITKAMQMVAAAKVRRAQERVLATRPYANKLDEMLKQVAISMGNEQLNDPLLHQRPVKQAAILVITSDKGLSGSYNTNAIRHAVHLIRDLKSKGIEPKLWLVGNIAINFFKHSNFTVVERFHHLPAIPTFSEARMLMESLSTAYRNGSVDQVYLVYTRFMSMIQFKPSDLTLLPLPRVQTFAKGEPQAQYDFEPSANEVMADLLPKYLEMQLYQALLESATSQLAAQMSAMSSASKNAQEMLQSLTILYNKVRQTGITREILEVVGGAEALRA